MKKTLIAIGLAAMVSSSQAQGLINFLNGATTLVTLTDDRQGVPNLGPIPTGVPGTYRFELFSAPAGTLTDGAAFVSSGLIATNINAAGRIIGGNGLAIPGRPLGGTAAILIRGWSANLGANYAQALANYQGGMGGFLGSSAIAPNFLLGGDGGAGNIPTSPAFGGSSGIQSGFALVYAPVPEPSSMVLAGLGAASLLLFRRRK